MDRTSDLATGAILAAVGGIGFLYVQRVYAECQNTLINAVYASCGQVTSAHWIALGLLIVGGAFLARGLFFHRG